MSMKKYIPIPIVLGSILIALLLPALPSSLFSLSLCSSSSLFFFFGANSLENSVNSLNTTSVIPTIAPFVLPSMLKALRSAHPACKLFVREDLSQALVNALQVKSRKTGKSIGRLPWETAQLLTPKLQQSWLPPPKKNAAHAKSLTIEQKRKSSLQSNVFSI